MRQNYINLRQTCDRPFKRYHVRLRKTYIRYDEGLAPDSHKTCVRLVSDHSKDITSDLRQTCIRLMSDYSKDITSDLC